MAGYSSVEFKEEGITVAMAHATMAHAMVLSGVGGSELARRLNVHRSRSVHILTRDMTMRTFARVLAACGYEVRFTLKRRSQRKGKA